MSSNESYLVDYKKNMENLRSQVEKLKLLATRRDLQRVENDQVPEWTQEAGKLLEECGKILDDRSRCFNGWCPNLISRYRLSKEAKKKIIDVNELLVRGNLKDTEINIEMKVLRALKDEQINIIGIRGIGGVGKTYLVNQVVKKAQTEKLFDGVIKVDLANLDLKMIGGEVDENLDMELWNGLKQGNKKILIILEDLWNGLNLDLGLPYRGCKIILTSPDSVFHKMGCQIIVDVPRLSFDKSMNLFKKEAGDTNWDSVEDLVKKDLVEECDRLPLAIITVARALKDKLSHIWRNALEELKISNSYHSHVYSCLKLSYDFLESEEAKSCFLLCCGFPENRDIKVDDLMKRGMEESVFKDFEKAATLVEELKDRGLLFDSDKQGCVEMHQTIRDIGLEIASAKWRSSESTKEQVMEALKDDKINIIGVYGMRGIGKTYLVEQIGKQAKEEKLYDKVVKVTVSRKQNLKKIQAELAKKLGMPLREESVEVRAVRLWDRLKQERKILIILDDLWDRLDLAQVGIPSQKGCQIIMTTQKKDVCGWMDCNKEIEVPILSEQESWNMFKEKAGDAVAKSHVLAWQVAKQCKGYPPAIVTVARLLNDNYRDGNFCDAALKDLIDGRKTCLELSCNKIRDEAKWCFLFCCLFPADSNIEVDVLTRYGMGERVFNDVNFQEASRRMHTLINTLKDLCLLYEGDVKGFVKVHDVVRDVGISIASRVEDGFLVKTGMELKVWPEKFDESKRLSLMETSIGTLPKRSKWPPLSTLLLQGSSGSGQIRNDLIEGMNDLVVLDVSDTGITSLPSSLPDLKNLRTLCLDRCKFLNDISLLGELVKLEVLSLRRSEINELPEEIKRLANLKVLDLTGTFGLQRIPQDVILKLSKLEELYMEDSFSKWEVTGSSGDGTTASFDEVASLTLLTTLCIGADNVKCLDVPVTWHKLEKFHICVGGQKFSPSTHERCISAKLMTYPVCNWIKLLFRSEEVHLKGCEGLDLKNVLFLNGGGFNSLKHLNLYDWSEMKHLVCTVEEAPQISFQMLQELELNKLKNLEKICHGPVPPGFFGKLRRLEIRSCGKLINIIPYDLLQGLQSLEELYVEYCKELEEVFNSEGEAGKSSVTSKPLSGLKEVKLQSLPKLSSIWKGFVPPTETLHKLKKLTVYQCESLRYLFSPVLAQNLQELEEVDICYCSKMEKMISNEEEDMKVYEEGLGLQQKQVAMSFPLHPTFRNLRKLSIDNCLSLKNLLSSSLAQGFQQLEELHVRFCDEMEEIISANEEGKVRVGILPRLTILHLWVHPKLTSFCYQHNIKGKRGSHVFLDWPALEWIQVFGCPNLKRLPLGSKSAPKLQKIQGETTWFQELEWEDESIKLRFQSLFVPFL
ncbi:putative disease resistance protein At4g27220 [Tasmannia lanceolata]|uniref:putative disease resistance protein At4g27220 n=1 Tax=Tasmannia lanceolata TaxID=3420 RepID=UPI004062A3BB